MKKLIGTLIAASALNANAAVVDLRCVMGEDTAHVTIDTEASELISHEGFDIGDVDVKATHVSFNSDFLTEELDWVRSWFVIDRPDLSVRMETYDLNEKAVGRNRFKYALLSGGFPLDKVTPDSRMVEPRHFEYMDSAEGQCELIEQQRAF